MKKKYILGVILLMVIGFASVATNLIVNGSFNLAMNDEDLDIYFSNAKENGVKNLSLIKDKKTIEFEANLKTVGERYVLDYEVANSSFQYDVAVNIKVETLDDEYLSVSNNFNTTKLLEAQDKREGKLVIELKKATVENKNVNVKVILEAEAKSRTKLGEVVYSEIESEDAYVENNVPYFLVNVSNSLDNRLVSPGATYNVTIENQDNYGNGMFYFVDSFGNTSSEAKEYQTRVVSNEYKFKDERDENVFKVYVKTNDEENRKVRYKVTISSSLNERIITDEITIPDANFCLENGINTLSECMIASDSMTSNLDAAKSKIESRVADFTKIEPQVVYATVTEKGVNPSASISTSVYFNDSKPTLNQSTGRYEWDNSKSVLGVIKDYVSTSDKKWYTCFHVDSSGACETLYTINDYIETTTNGVTTYKVSNADRYSIKITDTASANPGLYAADDDYGKSYYYRGAVENNYVSYAGFNWRIIRRNGDGSVRMLYSGFSPNSTGHSTRIKSDSDLYNDGKDLPNYVGYKYGMDQVLVHSDTVINNSYVISENSTYYFADDYICDETSKTCHLTGNMIASKWKNNYTNVINTYKYTCWSTSQNTNCNLISEVVGTINSGSSISTNTAKVKMHGFVPRNEEAMWTDENDSNSKKIIDGWYENNILKKMDENSVSYNEYVNDSQFCADREVYSKFNNWQTDILSSGVKFVASHRVYSLYKPSLVCNRDIDKFTVSNQKLKYPIALITSDEIAMAGGKNRSNNKLYYLYSGSSYWAMSASGYNVGLLSVSMGVVGANGNLDEMISSSAGLRPVINLKESVKITSGNGTKESPYQVGL